MSTAASILLIDDDSALASLYELILRQAGWRVTVAGDGVEGLRQVRAGGWDLILLDLMMPYLDGLGLLEELAKSPPARPNGPIVILSNASYDDIAGQAERLGVAALLLKADLLPRELVVQVKRFIDQQKR